MTLIVVAAMAAGAGLWLGQRQFGTAGSSAAPTRAALIYPQPRELPTFALKRADGATFGNADLRERWTLAFFGFTHCPDICPTTLAVLKQIRLALGDGPESPALQLLFVSVDPERDDAKALGDYAAYFDPTIVAATAGHDVLLPFTRALGVVYMTSDLPGGGYTVDHSAQLVLIDPKGRLIGLIRPPLDAALIAQDLVALDQSFP
jgi:protein SCO1/2